MMSNNRNFATFVLLILLSLSSYGFFLAYQNFNTFATQSYKIESTKIVSSLSIALAKERDLSASFLSSKGSLSKEELEEQRLQVNRLLKEFYDFFQTHDITPHLKTIMLPLTKLMDIRQAIDTLTVDFDTMFFDFYSHITFYLLKEFETIETPPALHNLSATLTLLYKHSEAIAQERGFITKVLNQNPPFLASDLAIWMSLFSLSDTLTYIPTQHPKVKSTLQNLSKIPENIKLDEEIIRTKTELLSQHKDKYPITSSAWFELLSQKIELLNESALMVEEILEKEKNSLRTNNLFLLVFASSLWLLTFVSLICVWFSKNNTLDTTMTMPSFHETPPPETSSLEEAAIPQTMSQTSILLLKKSPLENKLFKHMLARWCTQIDELTSYELFKEKIASRDDQLLLFDKEMLEEGEYAFHDWLRVTVEKHEMKNIHTIMFVDPKEYIEEEQELFDAITANQINQHALETLIRPFIA